ncbi:2-oxoglutarate-Fe(II) type oxidoreductase ppzD [Paramyrothecium foliicola]|nr:2-oxoglutarate-Fe(II) type oxidoreductase ppzD [Paramyrothecium foliicola]
MPLCTKNKRIATMGSIAFDEKREVPRLDFAKFLHGNVDEQKQLCQRLVWSLSNVGFVKLVNHGISEDDIRRVFKWNKDFFALPLEKKNKAAHPVQPNPHRGYSYVGQEKLSRVRDYEKGHRDAVEVHDIKESYDQGPIDDQLYPNRWPDEEDLPGFQQFMVSFYDTCHQVHLKILQALATGLGFKPSFLQDLCQENTSELRLNHYPKCQASAVQEGAMRISEHTDFGTLTLLFQDSIGGLEIEDQSKLGTYFPVEPQDQFEMIVNIGDCLQRWTNNKFRSTSHRVILSHNGSGLIEDRYSVAYFAKPNRTQSVGPLPQFVKDGQKPKYTDITAWEYNQEKLVLTY